LEVWFQGVKKMDNSILRIARFVLLTFIHWIAIFPVDSVIHLLKNPGLADISWLNRPLDSWMNENRYNQGENN